MKNLVLAAMFFVTYPAVAQDGLSRLDHGYLELSKCYRDCMNVYNYGVGRSTPYLYNWIIGSNSNQDQFVCLQAQAAFRTLDACRQGCVDVERIFGTANSNVRARFNTAYNFFHAFLTDAGLWVTYTTSPEFGTTEF